MNGNILKQSDLRRMHIMTDDYVFILQPGIYTALLERMAVCREGLRLFFLFDDGRKVIAIAPWWNKYLGFKEAQPGTRYLLTYSKRSSGVYLTFAEKVL